MHALVLQTDFGYGDGAVCAMYGVAESVSPELKIFNLTHDIEQYNIWDASYRLVQTIDYWPEGTVFVSVVDPGVGSDRRSIAALTEDGKVIITPDNGTLTHVKLLRGIKKVCIIDESKNRLPNSADTYTFHGRDVYAYAGAKLASEVIDFAGIGPEVPVDSVIELPITPPVVQDGLVSGTIDVLDIRFGNVWTNIPYEIIRKQGIEYGDRIRVKISNDTRTVYSNEMGFFHSFASAEAGEALAYINSLEYLAVAINLGSFAKAYNIGTGNSWHIDVKKI